MAGQYRKRLGYAGEQKAARFLKNKGYTILEHNWRYKNTEIDIIAFDGKKVIFVEVKRRKTLDFGYPEEAITASKRQSLRKAAETYLHQRSDNPDIRFDVIAIWEEEGREKIEHFEDAF